MDTQRGEQRVALDVAGDVAGYGGAPWRPGWPRVAACTRSGRGRVANEDAVAIVPEAGIFVAVDGMGGLRNARRAAELTAVELPERIHRALAGIPSREGGRIQAALTACLVAFSERLRRRDDEMGAAVVVAVVRGRRVFIAHGGDGRAHRFRGGELRPLTRDHTLVQALVDAGRLDVLSAKLHPARGVLLRYLGMPRPVFEVRSIRVRPHDRLLLSTDGVHGLLPAARLERLLGERAHCADAVAALLDLIEARGGRDDASAIVLDW